jgi:tetratricopeptide (TPR) repeat protein
MIESSNRKATKWSDACRRQQLARAFNSDANFNGWKDLAVAFEQEGCYDLVIKLWGKAFQKNRDTMGRNCYREELVQVYLKEAMHEDRIDVFEEAVEEHPSFYELWRCLAAEVTEIDDHERKIRMLEDLVARIPSHDEIELHLAEAYSLIGNTEKAIQTLEKAISHHLKDGQQWPFSLNPRLFRRLANLYIERCENQRALEVLSMGLKANKSVELSKSLAILWAHMGFFTSAKRTLLHAFKWHPTNLQLFDALCSSGGYDDAIRILRMEFTNVPKSELIAPIIYAFKARVNLDGAIQLLITAKNCRENGVESRSKVCEAISALYEEKGENLTRVGFCKEATKMNSTSAWSWILLTKAYESVGAWELARESYREIARKNTYSV